MINPKNTPTPTLTKIREARMLKHSQTNSLLTFKPIRLKSLQEARNELKSTSNRTMSHTSLDIDASFPSNFASTRCTSQNISPIKSLTSRFENISKIGSQTSKAVIEKIKEVPKKSNIIYKKTIPEVNKRKIVNNSLEIQKKIQGRVVTSEKSAKVTSVSGGNSKQPMSISEVLKIMENVKPNKRLTTGQEKGLVSRLQHKKVLKFLPKVKSQLKA